MVVLVIGVSVWFVVEVAKLHLDHTPRWPPEITPLTAQKLHHARGRYVPKLRGKIVGFGQWLSCAPQVCFHQLSGEPLSLRPVYSLFSILHGLNRSPFYPIAQDAA
jgi:hypothetical protein